MSSFSGPGSYETFRTVPNGKGGLIVSRDTRFKKLAAEDFPGPGAYEVTRTLFHGRLNIISPG